ncbi:nose resistant to fluoxetine protein 6 [Exaiptasia diaphana]|uniref:Nose resistant-to-fluoxetine protein N-terminal domain-containing protein n=1 Tax=Exaiptasia diaphana TaxID=2652724 RepID=A0A913WRG9_EXADI|nr:nose resistant to fluoxetine protein 6 [Exaiptasia diaphana]KXJ18551.1 Nose resistant to fluoxetine protein 6 [Exaiptasia diaphana]
MLLNPHCFVALISITCILTCFAVTPQMMLQSRKKIEDFHRNRLAQAVKNAKNISRECTEALVYLETSNNTDLLKTYVDAMGKPGSGIRYGNLDWLGSYSECKAIPGATYCLAGIGAKPKNGSKTPVNNPLASATFKWGLCVPKQCSETDIAVGLQDIIKAFGLESVIQLVDDLGLKSTASIAKAVNCAKPSKYTGGVIATLTLCGVLLFLCLCGTIIEIASSVSQLSIKKSNGFVPITNESPQEEQDSITVKGTDKFDTLTPSYSEHARETPVVYQHRQPNSVKEFFLSFSLIRNTTQIMNTNVPPNAITSINGMRVLSILWVVLGHVFAFLATNGLVSNLGILRNILQRFTFQVILSGVFAVDTFFFLSGLLVAYLSFRQVDKTKGSLNLFKFYFHRFWRLTPVYMFVLLFYDQLTQFLGEGPFWYEIQSKQPCDEYWWTNLLYINNFYPKAECMAWAWYLANDMQFFVISPFIIFAAYRFGKRGLGLSVGLLLMAGFISTAVILDYYKLGSTILDMNAGVGNANFFQYVYVKPYCRIAPYLVGMALGYLLHVIKDGPPRTHSWLFILCGWCAAIILALSPVFGTYKAFKKNPQPFTRTENVFYGTFSRFSWSLALAWVIYACHTGYGGLVDKILSARFWIPLSRLTYCVYLVHLVVLTVYLSSYQTVLFYSDVNASWHFMACTTISYFVAYIVSVSCEVPMMHLEKLVFKTDRK